MREALEPGRMTYEDKMVVRKAIEEANIPFTYISANLFVGYFADNLSQMGSFVPYREKVHLFGDGTLKAIFVDEDDVATYTIKTINYPHTLNKTLYRRPPNNVLSQGDGQNTNCFTLFTRTRPVKTRALTALNKKMMPMAKLVSHYQKRKDLMTIAGDALKTNITTLSPLVLSTSEQLLFFATLVANKFLKTKVKAYILDFKLAFEHFCIHARGRAVLDELKKNLQLSPWHELAYTKANGRVKKGDRIWKIAFGYGFKCNSAIWKALKAMNHNFPIEVPRVSSF